MASYLLPAFVLGVIGFTAFRSLYLRHGSIWAQVSLVLTALILATPAVLFTSNYLLDVPGANWFVYLHSLPGTEASSGLIVALLGIMFASSRLRPNPLNAPILVVSAAGALLLLVAPFGKQVFYRQDYSVLENRWKDNLCLQTSRSTCVPASCATVVRMLGGNLTERELAVEAGTTRRGTEIWYMTRAMRRHGYEIEIHSGSLRNAPVPSILGVKVGDAGHVVVLMSKTDAGPEIGDPLGPRRRYTWAAFENRYRPNGVYLVVVRRGDRHVGE